MYTCELNIYGVRLRVKSRQPERIRRLKTLCSLFVLPDVPDSDAGGEWIDEEELDILSLLAGYNIFAFHAAAYKNKNGEGLFLPGNSASGKSTITCSALSAGYSIVGDDVVLFRQEGSDFNLSPFKSYLLLKKRGEDRILNVLEHYPRAVFCSVNVATIVFPRIVTDRKSTITKLDDRKKIFLKLLENTIWANSGILRERQASLLEKLSELPAYCLSLGIDHRTRPQIAIELLDRIAICSH